MVKTRPAIVISPRLPRRDNLCAIVPLSGTHDGRDYPYIVRIELDPPLPAPYDHNVMWAKCDMLATVSLERLDLFRTGRDHTGKRKYLDLKIAQQDFDRVRNGILCGLGFVNLTFINK